MLAGLYRGIFKVMNKRKLQESLNVSGLPSRIINKTMKFTIKIIMFLFPEHLLYAHHHAKDASYNVSFNRHARPGLNTTSEQVFKLILKPELFI